MGSELQPQESSEERNKGINGRINWSKFDIMIKNRLRARKGRTVRSQDSIQIAILEACRSPSVEHWIMIKARLGYETFWAHTSKLLRDGMVNRLVENGRGRTLYSITEKGLVKLESLKATDSSYAT